MIFLSDGTTGVPAVVELVQVSGADETTIAQTIAAHGRRGRYSFVIPHIPSNTALIRATVNLHNGSVLVKDQPFAIGGSIRNLNIILPASLQDLLIYVNIPTPNTSAVPSTNGNHTTSIENSTIPPANTSEVNSSSILNDSLTNNDSLTTTGQSAAGVTQGNRGQQYGFGLLPSYRERSQPSATDPTPENVVKLNVLNLGDDITLESEYPVSAMLGARVTRDWETFVYVTIEEVQEGILSAPARQGLDWYMYVEPPRSRTEGDAADNIPASQWRMVSSSVSDGRIATRVRDPGVYALGTTRESTVTEPSRAIVREPTTLIGIVTSAGREVPRGVPITVRNLDTGEEFSLRTGSGPLAAGFELTMHGVDGHVLEIQSASRQYEGSARVTARAGAMRERIELRGARTLVAATGRIISESTGTYNPAAGALFVVLGIVAGMILFVVLRRKT
jgi:hypothetical protein